LWTYSYLAFPESGDGNGKINFFMPGDFTPLELATDWIISILFDCPMGIDKSRRRHVLLASPCIHVAHKEDMA
jgi:hypothetical protein